MLFAPIIASLTFFLYINVKLRKVYGYIKQITVRISPQAREHMAMYVVKSIYSQIYDQVYGSIYRHEMQNW